MPFGLKNARATCQWLVSTVFKPLIGKTIEVYVDDMLVKSSKEHNHIKDFYNAFAILKMYNMKLNLQKRVFGVKSSKFLGFMVTS